MVLDDATAEGYETGSCFAGMGAFKARYHTIQHCGIPSLHWLVCLAKRGGGGG
jgi:hypothetical protein